MKGVFADTAFWVAIFNAADELHEPAKNARQTIGNVRLVTTDEVLIEVLNYFSELGEKFRVFAVNTVRAILGDPNTRVLPQSRDSFLAGLRLYSERSDKGYSLTDCISMAIMKNESITLVLTHDHHFAQEGFEVLF